MILNTGNFDAQAEQKSTIEEPFTANVWTWIHTKRSTVEHHQSYMCQNLNLNIIEFV